MDHSNSTKFTSRVLVSKLVFYIDMIFIQHVHCSVKRPIYYVFAKPIPILIICVLDCFFILFSYCVLYCVFYVSVNKV